MGIEQLWVVSVFPYGFLCQLHDTTGEVGKDPPKLTVVHHLGAVQFAVCVYATLPDKLYAFVETTCGLAVDDHYPHPAVGGLLLHNH